MMHLGQYEVRRPFFDGTVTYSPGDYVKHDVVSAWPNFVAMKNQGFIVPVDDGDCDFVAAKRFDDCEVRYYAGTIIESKVARSWKNYQFLRSRGYIEPCKTAKASEPESAPQQKRGPGRPRKVIQ